MYFVFLYLSFLIVNQYFIWHIIKLLDIKFILFAAGVVAAQQSDNQCADSKKVLDDAWMSYKEGEL